MPHRHVNLVRSGEVPARPPVPATLDNCEREPIHIPGLIQPHGALIAFEAGSGVIRHVSDNLGDWLPVGALPSRGRALGSLLDASSWARVESGLRAMAAQGVRHEVVELRGAGGNERSTLLEGTVHQYRGQCLLEIERAPDVAIDGLQAHADISAALRSSSDLGELLLRLAQEAKKFSGMDRVMIYRFDQDWHGEVVAEVCEPEMEPYLGLHYPASDIPAQARELYRAVPVRYIADVGYRAVPIRPWADPVSREPLDMSHAVLRSVSPMHIQYLKNMGVGATLTISLIVDGQLWGLVACHHRVPVQVCARVRQVFAALSSTAGYLVGWHLERIRSQAASVRSTTQARVVTLFNQSEVPLTDLVAAATVPLLQLVGATAGAFWHRGEFVPFGRWPNGSLGRELQSMAEKTLAVESSDLHAFESLDMGRPPTYEDLKVACGAMILRLGDFTDSGVMWLRPEARSEVAWGGDPDKPVSVALDTQGQPVLSPRTSFERWTTLVRGRCRPWTDLDKEAARSMLPLRQVLAVHDSLAEARSSDRRFRALIELQSDAYWQVDGDGHLLALSKPLAVDLGRADDRTLPDLLAPVFTEISVSALRAALKRGESFRDVRLTSQSEGADGELVLEISGDPLRDRQFRVVGFHGTVNDVSVSRKAAREQQLREAAELAARTKGRFLSQVSHELRTPLNAILGHTQLLLDDGTASALQRDHLLSIEKAGEWLLTMITDLLDIASIEAGRIDLDMVTVDPAQVAQRVVETLQTQANAADVTLHVQAPSDPVWVHADATRLRQILINLVGNAIKYNRPDGSVTLNVARASAERVTIDIQDTGQGLDTTQRAHLFEPFNRLGREAQKTPGTGIGLVIARQLAEAMGGRIEVESEPSVGSRFTLSLVAATRKMVDESEQTVPPEPAALNATAAPSAHSHALAAIDPACTVIYVEDEPTNVVLMSAVVEGLAGVTMLHASTAEEGLDMALQVRPAALLIDLNLPDKDGLWLVKAVRAHEALASIPCVAVTADAMRETLLRARAHGFNQCWTKPLDLRWTGRTLHALLGAAATGLAWPPVRFDDEHALAALAAAPTPWFDALDFGVVRLDAALHATAYNLYEARITGYEPAAVLGKPFFKNVGPCMDNPLVAGRLAGRGPLDVTLEYAFRLRLRRDPVRLRLLSSPDWEHRFLLVDRLY